MFPTGLPSIARLTPTFHPKFADLATIKRPAGRARRAAAVSIEAAQRKTRIRKRVVTDVNLDFIASCYLGISFCRIPRTEIFHHSLKSPLCSCGSISLAPFGKTDKVTGRYRRVNKFGTAKPTPTGVS